MAGLTGDDVLCLTFSGLSKAYRVCGYRAGWMAISGPKKEASDYLEGINLLANMRLCANVPAQHAIQTALGGYQSINDLILPGGRLLEQRNKAYDMLNAIPGVWTPRSSTSVMTRSSSWTCSRNRRSSCPTAGRSTGCGPTTSGW
jgi:alanine-synthesizing transaminase